MTDGMIKKRKQAYYKRACEKLKQSGAHNVPYKALKSLAVAERPPLLDPANIIPHFSKQELVNDLADFFGGISNEFQAFEPQRIPEMYDRPITPLAENDVAQRLIGMKKPRSSVTIDPLSRFVNVHALSMFTLRYSLPSLYI